jgi:hypothetical protein
MRDSEDSEDSSLRLLKMTPLKNIFFDSGYRAKRRVCYPFHLKAVFHILPRNSI